MRTRLVTVVETKAFSAAARGRMTTDEVDALVDLLAAEPERGDVIQGTGGLRVVYYFYNDTMPVFLLTMFAKNEKDNLSAAERNALAKVTRSLRASYGA